MNRENIFATLYAQLGIMEKSGGCFALHQSCESAATCWSEVPEHRVPHGCDGNWNYVYAPFFGRSYGKTRLMVVAENMNEFGGWHAVDDLVAGAKKEITAGITRVRFENDWKKYPGSFLWHRLGSYGAAFAEHLGQIQRVTWLKNGFPDFPDVCRGFDYLAFTNHVKCSPTGSRSKPTSQMWANCGRHILRQEIKLASPSCLLVLGTAWNRWAFDSYVFSEESYRPKTGVAFVGNARIDDMALAVVVLPHPSWFRVSPSIVMADFKKAIEILLAEHLLS